MTDASPFGWLGYVEQMCGEEEEVEGEGSNQSLILGNSFLMKNL